MKFIERERERERELKIEAVKQNKKILIRPFYTCKVLFVLIIYPMEFSTFCLCYLSKFQLHCLYSVGNR